MLHLPFHFSDYRVAVLRFGIEKAHIVLIGFQLLTALFACPDQTFAFARQFAGVA